MKILIEYIAKNISKNPKDIEIEEAKEEITSQLLQQKVSQKFSEWFGKLREEAKISNFM